MGYRAFNEKTSFEDAHDSVVYTAEALGAHPEAGVAGMAAPLDALLGEAPGLFLKENDARRGLVRANARIRAWDGFVDDLFRDFSRDVLGAVRQDREAPLYMALFPKLAPHQVIALSLAPEAEEINRIVGVLAAESTPATLRESWLSRLKEASAKATSLLDERKTASAARSSLSDQQTRWIERADRARRAIHGALTQHAASRDLPRDFNDRFFPQAPRKKADELSV